MDRRQLGVSHMVAATEEDTFLKLVRRPIAEVIEDWYIIGRITVSIKEYAKQEKYTLAELLSAWYDIHLSNKANSPKSINVNGCKII